MFWTIIGALAAYEAIRSIQLGPSEETVQNHEYFSVPRMPACLKGKPHSFNEWLPGIANSRAQLMGNTESRTCTVCGLVETRGDCVGWAL